MLLALPSIVAIFGYPCLPRIRGFREVLRLYQSIFVPHNRMRSLRVRYCECSVAGDDNPHALITVIICNLSIISYAVNSTSVGLHSPTKYSGHYLHTIWPTCDKFLSSKPRTDTTMVNFYLVKSECPDTYHCLTGTGYS